MWRRTKSNSHDGKPKSLSTTIQQLEVSYLSSMKKANRWFSEALHTIKNMEQLIESSPLINKLKMNNLNNNKPFLFPLSLNTIL